MRASACGDPGAPWEFSNPVRILAGAGRAGRVAELAQVATPGGGAVVVVTSAGARARGDLHAVLDGFASDPHVVTADPNPDVQELDDELDRLRSLAIACVVAVGGGSVMDTAKVLAVGLGNPEFTVRGFVAGESPLPDRRRVRLVCVPTTAGTGSEVTPYATVWDRPNAKKHSVSGPIVFPDVAVVDPVLTLTVPREITASTGLDALIQAFEATWSRRANPVADAYAVRALRRGLVTLGPLCANLDDLALRAEMLDASLLAGLAISSTRTALCHSISYPITGHYGVPHGLACAVTLPEVFAFNREGAPAWADALAGSLGLDDAGDLARRIDALLEELGVAGLLAPSFAGRPHPAALADQMLTPGRADNNLRSATVEDVARIVRAAVARLDLPVTPEPPS